MGVLVVNRRRVVSGVAQIRRLAGEALVVAAGAKVNFPQRIDRKRLGNPERDRRKAVVTTGEGANPALAIVAIALGKTGQARAKVCPDDNLEAWQSRRAQLAQQAIQVRRRAPNV